jgi:Ca2+-binding EF-hand superfamily protein
MDMIRDLTLLAAAAVVALPLGLAAQDNEKKPAVAGDVLKGAIDPFSPGTERSKFLKAASVDTELDKAEFEANAKVKDGFVRVYDKWSALISFDKNKDGNIDWFEANNYRKGLKAAVIAKYDKDGNKKLNGDERTAANKDLAAGKAPKPIKTVAGAGGGNDLPGARPGNRPGNRGGNQQQAELLRRLQKGEVTAEERKFLANGLVAGRTQALGRWDKNNDGLLDDAERAAMEADEQAKWLLKVNDLSMKHFDEDGDGKLSNEEAEGVVKFGEEVAKMSAQWYTKIVDADGDGEVTPQEMRLMQGRVQMIGFSLLPKAMTWADSDGDGRVSPEEGRQIGERVAKKSEENIKKITEKFDANGDGRLNAQERSALVKGMDEDINKRYSQADTNGDGKLDNTELTAMIEGLAGEIGIKSK